MTVSASRAGGAVLLAAVAAAASCSIVNVPDEPEPPVSTSTGSTTSGGGGGSDGGATSSPGGSGGGGGAGGAGGECAATDEVCDGEDNNCNDLIDEGIAEIQCGVGACETTIPGCIDGEVPACVPAEPGDEICNGLDDDCNGQSDDGVLAVMCPLPENAASVSCAGALGCTASCNEGFEDCDPNALSPCNTNTLTSDQHCGGCDAPCDVNGGYSCVGGSCALPILWVFANYNGGPTAWVPTVEWNGTISCGTTCGHVGRTAVGVRFICNLNGYSDTEGCTAAIDGQYGTANCGLWIDQGVTKDNGSSEDCTYGQLSDCVSSSCSESVTFHAIECQCAL